MLIYWVFCSKKNVLNYQNYDGFRRRVQISYSIIVSKSFNFLLDKILLIVNVSFSGGYATGEGSSVYPKNWVNTPPSSCSFPSQALFCSRNVEFTIFMQFVAISAKIILPHQLNPIETLLVNFNICFKHWKYYPGLEKLDAHLCLPCI